MKFKASVTYQETTPESAEIGDFSDCGHVETDLIFDDMEDLINYMSREGFHFPSGSPINGHTWFSTQWFTKDYGTGTERQENIHIEAPADIKRTIYKILEKKASLNYAYYENKLTTS